MVWGEGGGVGWGVDCVFFSKTYHDGKATENQVPQQVLFPVELGMCGLQLAQVLEHKICVHDDAQFRACQEEAGAKSPNLGREFEDLEIVEVEPPDREEAEVTANRGCQDGSGKRPARLHVRPGSHRRERAQ